MAFTLPPARQATPEEWFIYQYYTGTQWRIFHYNTRSNVEFEITPIQTPNARFHSWSPDGGWFYIENYNEDTYRTTLYRASRHGQSPQQLTDPAYDSRLVGWSSDGKWLLLLQTQAQQGIYRMPLDGGDPILLSNDLQVIRVGGVWGDTVYFTAYDQGQAGIYRLNSLDGEPQLVHASGEDDLFVSISPQGEHLLMIDNTLAVVEFYAISLQDPIERINFPINEEQIRFGDWFPDGSGFFYEERIEIAYWQLFSVTFDDPMPQQIAPDFENSEFSQIDYDGNWVYFHAALPGGFNDLYRVRLDGSQLSDVLPQMGNVYLRGLSENNEWLFFRRYPDSPWEKLYKARVDDPQAEPNILVDKPNRDLRFLGWSPPVELPFQMMRLLIGAACCGMMVLVPQIIQRVRV